MTLRAVLDTNVVLSAQKSVNAQSPSQEILDRWQAGEFDFLYSADTLAEYAEKLLEHGISEAHIVRLLRLIARHAQVVTITWFHLRHYPADSDDVMFLLCALNGAATHLVTYDAHLLDLHTFYAEEVHIVRPLNFLAACRQG